MATELITPEHINKAVNLLKDGCVVAFPTETVYGLGAIANSDEAIKKVYAAKGRPSDNPLIVHVASKQLDDYVVNLPAYAKRMIHQFWPGPLTIICHVKENIFSTLVHPKLQTVAFRMPNNKLTLDVIEKVGFPIVGPSANTSGKPSPTRAAHVLDDFYGVIEGVLYGENATIGIESTVIDVTDPNGFVLLRPGAITLDDLKDFPMKSGNDTSLEMEHNTKNETTHQTSEQTDVPMSPGMKYKHYAPRQPIYLIDSQQPDMWDKAFQYFSKERLKIGILADDNLVDCYEKSAYNSYNLGGIEDAVAASRVLYDGLRFFDKSEVDVILAQAYEKKGIGIALMNRLEKAADGVYFE